MTAIYAKRHSERGFTLLEAMVALIIVSLGMLAVSAQLGRFAAASFDIEQKTLASWIATNKITELSIAREWPELGTQREEVEFGNRLWHLRTEISETDVDNLRRVDVYVTRADDPDRVVARPVTGLIEPPPQQRAARPIGYGPTGLSGGDRG
jgi:general secretion pathway protein I